MHSQDPQIRPEPSRPASRTDSPRPPTRRVRRSKRRGSTLTRAQREELARVAARAPLPSPELLARLRGYLPPPPGG
jgi:hypothetical protein